MSLKENAQAGVESVPAMLTRLQALGVHLWSEDGQLRFKAPAGVLSETLRSEIKVAREALLRHLERAAGRRLEADIKARHAPFPLTDLQLAYLVGRTRLYDYGGVGCHSYIELDLPAIDAAALEQAWHRLILRHDMLRAVVSPEGHQAVLRHVALPALRHLDVRGIGAAAAAAALAGVREEMGQRCYVTDQWPLHELRLSSHDGGAVLHFSIDLLIADFASIQIMLAELGQFYHQPALQPEPLQIGYRDLVLAQRAAGADAQAAARMERDRLYWHGRIDAGFPAPPELPVLTREERALTEAEPVRFERLHFELAPQQWQSLRARAAACGNTTSSVVLSAFADILGRWSRRQQFCLNLTLLNRPALHPDVNRVVGDFIAVNVLAVEPQPQTSFSARAAQLQQRLLQDMEHGSFTGIDVLRELSQRNGRQTIVPVVFTSTVGVSGEGLDGNDFMQGASLRYGITQTPQVWLDCQVTERGATLHVDWDVRGGVFKAGVIGPAFAAFTDLLERLADGDAAWQARQGVPLPAATQAVRAAVNRSWRAPSEDLLHSGFCRQVQAAPEAVALVADERAWSYGELGAWAARIAALLRHAGCDAAKAAPVAIVLDKGAAQIAAVLGALLAGASYVPLDARQPRLRRDAILADVGAQFVLSDTAQLAAHPGDTWPARLQCIAVDGLEQGSHAAAALRQALAQPTLHPDRPAYILYTSGTTGVPKGVVVSHRAALNTVADINRRFAVGAADRVLGLANFNFDLSVWDMFGAFNAGAALVLPQAQRRGDPGHWAELAAAHKVTLWNSVPAQMQMLMSLIDGQPGVAAQLATLRLVMLSGDWIPLSLPPQLRARCPAARLVSLGGPTETAIWCVWHPIGESAPGAASIPYGTPLDNHRLYILNDSLEDCPDWVAGQMYIGGAGLALGYANDAARTAQSFIDHPLSGERLYRSGDMGRYRPDGVIEILGREDRQVKILGHRIELGEVEAAALAQPGVGQAAALVLAGPSLALAVVAAAGAGEAQLAGLRAGMAARLPDYMVPVQIRQLEALPLSVNGKIDRNALGALLAAAPAGPARVYQAPRTDGIEGALAAVWCELLGLERVARDDDFFQIGGSSLSAIALLSKLMAQGHAVDIELIFGNTLFHDMAQALERSRERENAFLAGIDLDAIAATALAGVGAASPHDPAQPPRRLLLTGATGYLGIYTLAALLAGGAYEIHCLVRCDDVAAGRQRLRQAAAQKGLRLDADAAQLHIVCGDVAQERLGVDAERYRWLSEHIDCIVHGASMINLMDPLARLYPTNVLGAARIIELAATARVKPVHYISTIAVHHALPEGAPEPVAETVAASDAWAQLRLTYEQSKTMAEQLFYRARLAGIPVNVLRPGTITWDSGLHSDRQDGAGPYINDDAFLKFYRACLAVSAYPRSALTINIVPVDYVARAIACVVASATGASTNYHLVSQSSIPVDQVYRALGEMGCVFDALDFPQWKARLQDSFVEGFVNLYFRDGMDSGGHHQYASDALRQVLERHGVAGFEVGPDYLALLYRQFNNAVAGVAP